MVAAPSLFELMRAIARKDGSALPLLEAAPHLAREALKLGATRQNPTDWYFTSIGHYVYEGDTALHVAAAAYDSVTAARLLALGADVAAVNRRGAQPLHYASDGGPDSATWDPPAQAAIVSLLIEAGADPNATDKSGVGPLHRAVRTRCSAAVRALLDGGADPARPNRTGSTPLYLAEHTTGRGGSGSAAARAEQEAIIELLRARVSRAE